MRFLFLFIERSEKMKISIKKMGINPSIPSYLSGQINRVKKHTGILDDLYCTALMIEYNQSKMVFISYDLLQFDDYLSNRIRFEVSNKIGINPSNVFTIPSHTHAAPEVLSDGLFGVKTESCVPEGYLDFLTDISVETVESLNQNLIEVTLEYSEIEIDGFYGNRNNKDAYADKKIRFIQFKNDNKTIGIFVNLSCHPTILGPKNTLISSDLYGVIRSKLEELYHCPILITNGAEGDVSNRHYRISDDVNELIRTGNGIMNQIPYPLPSVKLNWYKLEVYSKQFEFKCDIDTKRINDAILRNNQLILNTSDVDQLKILNATNTVLYHQLNQKNLKSCIIQYSLIDFGEIMFIAIPMELFSSLYKMLISELDHIIIIGLTNTSIGYCVDELSYENTYEGLTSPLIKGEGERFIRHLIQEVKQIRLK